MYCCKWNKQHSSSSPGAFLYNDVNGFGVMKSIESMYDDILAVAMERVLQRNVDVDRRWRWPAIQDRTRKNLQAQHGITKE